MLTSDRFRKCSIETLSLLPTIAKILINTQDISVTLLNVLLCEKLYCVKNSIGVNKKFCAEKFYNKSSKSPIPPAYMGSKNKSRGFHTFIKNTGFCKRRSVLLLPRSSMWASSSVYCRHRPVKHTGATRTPFAVDVWALHVVLNTHTKHFLLDIIILIIRLHVYTFRVLAALLNGISRRTIRPKCGPFQFS